MWSLIDRNCNDIPGILTVGNLTRKVYDVWKRLQDSEYCEKLVDSMRDRLTDCIFSKGYYII